MAKRICWAVSMFEVFVDETASTEVAWSLPRAAPAPMVDVAPMRRLHSVVKTPVRFSIISPTVTKIGVIVSSRLRVRSPREGSARSAMSIASRSESKVISTSRVPAAAVAMADVGETDSREVSAIEVATQRDTPGEPAEDLVEAVAMPEIQVMVRRADRVRGSFSASASATKGY
jgi:hypothetical protein